MDIDVHLISGNDCITKKSHAHHIFKNLYNLIHLS